MVYSCLGYFLFLLEVWQSSVSSCPPFTTVSNVQLIAWFMTFCNGKMTIFEWSLANWVGLLLDVFDRCLCLLCFFVQVCSMLFIFFSPMWFLVI